MNEERVFAKLDSIENQNLNMLVEITKLSEQIKEVPDLRARMRAIEQWRWMVVGALGAGGGSLGFQIISAFKGGA